MNINSLLKISYTTWKAVVLNNSFNTYYVVEGIDIRDVWTGTHEHLFNAVVDADSYDDWVSAFESSAVKVSSQDDAKAQIIGVDNVVTTATTEDGLLRVSAERPIDGNKLTAITPDWGDKTSWYYKSRKILDGYQLVDSGDHTTYEGYGIWIDNAHGKYTDEDFLTNDLGEIPRLKVYVDGYLKSENDPDTGSGDFSVNYENATVTFNSALSTEAVVTIDAWVEQGSVWVLCPDPGKKIVLDYAEAQFSTDIKLTDTAIFQVYVYNPYDLPNKIPYGNPDKYKRIMDYVNGASKSYPKILKTNPTNPTWRDLNEDLFVFSWDYTTGIELKSSLGAELRVFTENDKNFVGTATVTFYCRVFNE